MYASWDHAAESLRVNVLGRKHNLWKNANIILKDVLRKSIMTTTRWDLYRHMTTTPWSSTWITCFENLKNWYLGKRWNIQLNQLLSNFCVTYLIICLGKKIPGFSIKTFQTSNTIQDIHRMRHLVVNLSVVKLSVVKLSVVKLSVVYLSVVKLSSCEFVSCVIVVVKLRLWNCGCEFAYI